ncbi:hypothetical protein Q6D67_11940 [Haliea sp. E1-2-M8]|uniref:DUF6586 family protein n=1 Tax=Haliea sp. E1-2-M8 TaxID=3064706 RepID=UPI0027247A30|nr:DUF6586 family protein [Haliea sp. E1-2-M8]MDO8862412.1 hypothetical protein [Haliea sp. E1-2-M8]
MSSPRGQANHRLYLARLLLAAWRRDLAAEDIPASVLAQAFGPAVRSHLLDAYGWFLLDLQQPAQLPATPPHSVTALPPVAPGKAVPAEIAEFAQLEQQGWLAELLQEPGAEQHRRSAASLAAPAAHLLDPDSLQAQAQLLDDAFARMGDFLDEC